MKAGIEISNNMTVSMGCVDVPREQHYYLSGVDDEIRFDVILRRTSPSFYYASWSKSNIKDISITLVISVFHILQNKSEKKSPDNFECALLLHQ